MATERRAEVSWRGDLMSGAGEIESVGSGTIGAVGVSWPARTRKPNGRTSPEELIAAAHAACFSMALSNIIAEAGHEPRSVSTGAKAHLRNVDGAPTIASIQLDVDAKVPGIEDGEFQRHADEAKRDCPLSRALASVPEIELNARLAA